MKIYKHRQDPIWYICTGQINGKSVTGQGTTHIEAFNSALQDYMVIIRLTN